MKIDDELHAAAASAAKRALRRYRHLSPDDAYTWGLWGAWRASKTWDGVRSRESWLAYKAWMAIREQLRRPTRLMFDPLQLDIDEAREPVAETPWAPRDRERERELIGWLLERLPVHCVEAIDLVAFEGLHQEAAGRALGVTGSAVNHALKKARITLSRREVVEALCA